MWFEIIPSAAIICTFLAIPTYAMYGVHKLTIGNGYRRNLDKECDRIFYRRDCRLTENPYIMNGLDAIPDK